MKSVCQILTTIGCSFLVLYGGPPIGTIRSFAVREIGRESKQVQLGTSRATVVVFVSSTVTAVPGLSMSVTVTRTPFTVTSTGNGTGSRLASSGLSHMGGV